MYCVIKCVKTKRVLKGNFVSSVFHSCNAKDANLRHRSAMCLHSCQKLDVSIAVHYIHVSCIYLPIPCSLEHFVHRHQHV
jgi:hypothetical protein